MLLWSVRNPFFPLLLAEALKAFYYFTTFAVVGSAPDWSVLLTLLLTQGVCGLFVGAVFLRDRLPASPPRSFWGYQALGLLNVASAGLPVFAYWLGVPFKFVQLASVPLIALFQALYARAKGHFSFGRSHLRVVLAVLALALLFGFRVSVYAVLPLALIAIPTFSERAVSWTLAQLILINRAILSVLRSLAVSMILVLIVLGGIVWIGAKQVTIGIPPLLWWTAGGMFLAIVTVYRDQLGRDLKDAYVEPFLGVQDEEELRERFKEATLYDVFYGALPLLIVGGGGMLLSKFTFHAALPTDREVMLLTFASLSLVLGIIIQRWVSKTKGGFRENTTGLLSRMPMLYTTGAIFGLYPFEAGPVLGIFIAVIALFDQYLAFKRWREEKERKETARANG